MRFLFVVAAAWASVCAAQEQSDWERRNLKPEDSEEKAVAPPAYPRKDTLIEFSVGASDFRFFIDGATLGVGSDRIVRYVLVARSPGGAENVSFEAMRCAAGEYRSYAFGRPDGTWSPAAGQWRAMQRWHRTLQHEYFCPQTQPIRDAAEGVRALEQGGHPFARSLGAGNPAGR